MIFDFWFDGRNLESRCHSQEIEEKFCYHDAFNSKSWCSGRRVSSSICARWKLVKLGSYIEIIPDMLVSRRPAADVHIYSADYYQPFNGLHRWTHNQAALSSELILRIYSYTPVRYQNGWCPSLQLQRRPVADSCDCSLCLLTSRTCGYIVATHACSTRKTIAIRSAPNIYDNYIATHKTAINMFTVIKYTKN